MLLIFAIIPNPSARATRSHILWVVLAAELHGMKHSGEHQVDAVRSIFAKFIKIPRYIEHLLAGWARHSALAIVGFPCLLRPRLLNGANLGPVFEAISAE